MNPTIAPATYTFDNAGNTKVDATGQIFTYDAENKQILVKDANGNTIGEYFYDGDGKRVKKIANSEETIFVYNASGQLIADYATQISQTPKVSYLTSDHLGSPKITTDANGDIYTRRDFMPFGEEIDINHTPERKTELNYASDEIRQKFTTYERDNETELDFAEARMHNYYLGRFTAPDPIYFTEERLSDPQAINLYVYVRNNPLALIDPTGLDFEFTGKDKDKFTDDLNKRDGRQFQVELDGNNIVQVIDKDKVDISKLSKSELALFNAINDPTTRVIIEGITQNAGVDFGGFKGKGHNLLDASDMDKLRNFDKKGGTGAAAAGHVVAHEMMEAYTTAKTNTNGMSPLQIYDVGHTAASKLFSEPKLAGRTLSGKSFDDTKKFPGIFIDCTITGGGKTRKFSTKVKFLRTWTDVEIANRGALPPGNITKVFKTPKKKK